jgi:hypothetical protein
MTATTRARKPATAREVIASTMSERQLQDAVTHLLTACGWLIYHTHDSRRSNAGFPDLIALCGRWHLANELKSQRGRIRPEQTIWMAAYREAGVTVCLWRPEHWLDGTIERVVREHLH